jgi:N-formylglutamate amidohydrolase
MYFSVREPDGAETAVIVEVPHAGLFVDPPALGTLVAPARALGRDADLYVDELYADAPAEGATLLVAHVSRYVCDLNRPEEDVDGQAVEGGQSRSAPHGLVWVKTTDQEPALERPLPRSELQRRLQTIYRPYHETLARLLERKHARFGWAVLLSAHSMPSQGRSGGDARERIRADIVPGSRGRSSAAGPVIDAADHLARQRGWTVAHDRPYRGGYAVGRHGKPAEGRHAVQVEIVRRLYMDEATLTRKPGEFEAVRTYCRSLVAHLGGLRLG